MTAAEIVSVSPMICIALGALLLLFTDVLGLAKTTKPVIFITSIIAAIYFSLDMSLYNEAVFKSALFCNSYTLIYTVAILLGTLFTYLLGLGGSLENQGVKSGVEIDFLLLSTTLGSLLLVSAANFISLFVGFELLSVSVYVLAGAALHQKASAESALKYFLLGAFSSCFLLYGISLVYGASGTINFVELVPQLQTRGDLFIWGILLIIFGFAFKVSLFPFHVWTPDVYQGAPTSITAFMAVVVKLGAFGAFLRLFSVCFIDTVQIWGNVAWVMAALSMTVGNVLAIQQTSIKRMLAYSSVAHAGYIFIGFLGLSSGEDVSEVPTYYLFAYSIMTLSSFGIVSLVTANSKYQYEKDSLKSFQGLGWRRPWLGIAMTISMLALAGMPPLVGFLGKLYLFMSAHQSGFTGLAIIAALNSVISMYYYLRVIVEMYFKEPEESAEVIALPFGPVLAVTFSSVLVVVLGVYSQPLFLVVQSAFK
jgi:NADH-quinone oxidoreductase subunit N